MTNREKDSQTASLADNVTGSTLRAFADGRASMRKEIAARLHEIDKAGNYFTMSEGIVALISDLEGP
jgi:hypothetical protein